MENVKRVMLKEFGNENLDSILFHMYKAALHLIKSLKMSFDDLIDNDKSLSIEERRTLKQAFEKDLKYLIK